MAIHKIFVDSPKLLAPRLNTIPNDGGDYEITLASNIYRASYLTPPEIDIALDHRAGGKIVLLPHGGNPVRIQGEDSGIPFAITARDIAVHGIHFGDDIPYFTSADNIHPIRATFGATDALFNHVCDPTSLVITDCTTNGRSQVFASGSNDPALYTDIRIINCRTEDTGVNASFMVYGSSEILGSDGLYAHIVIDNLIGNGKNGPDGTISNSHRDGCAAFDIGRLDGTSTVIVTRARHLSQIFGNLNHDLHCFRFGFIQSPDVRLTFRDCIWEGRWEAGHALGEGGGNLWLGYYHSGGLDCPDPTSRPRADFENCTFTGYIAPGVLELPGDMSGGLVNLFQCGSSANYHFWDCHFSWDVPAAFQSATFVATLVAVPNNSTFNLHNTLITGITNLPAAAPPALVTTDALSRANPGQPWGRVPTIF